MFVGVTSSAAAGWQDLQLDSTQNARIEPTELGGVSGASFEGVSGNKVELEILAEARPTVNTHGRDPFRRSGVVEVERRGGMAQDAPAVDSLGAVVSVGESRDIDDGQLDMIGVVQTGNAGERIAVLTDGGVVLHGRKGEIIDGRYRIVDVMPTAVMIEFIHDGVQQLVELSEF